MNQNERQNGRCFAAFFRRASGQSRRLLQWFRPSCYLIDKVARLPLRGEAGFPRAPSKYEGAQPWKTVGLLLSAATRHALNETTRQVARGFFSPATQRPLEAQSCHQEASQQRPSSDPKNEGDRPCSVQQRAERQPHAKNSSDGPRNSTN